MKTAKKADPQTNRERQKTFRQEARKAGWKKVSFYLSPQERAELDEYCNGGQLAYAIIVAVRESKYLRRHVAEMMGREKFM